MSEKAKKEEITIVRATLADAELIHEMKYQSFLPLYEKYHDDASSPATETLERTVKLLNLEDSEYFLIKWQGETVGAVRVCINKMMRRISPLFILPEYQNRGIAAIVMNILFERYENIVAWRLDTILQEAGNCYLYEKIGFIRTGKEKAINDQMTLIFYDKLNVTVRPLQAEDTESLPEEIVQGFERFKGLESAQKYIACFEGKIVGVGAVAQTSNQTVLGVLVLPEYRKLGIGRAVIRKMEEDALFVRTQHLEILSSEADAEFYQKMGCNSYAK